MSQESKNSTTRRINYTAVCMALGLVLGGFLGIILDNLVFAGGGMVIGLAIGTAIDKRNEAY